nr:hypothetical protein [uncultured Butyrivibrio sp.]
MKKTLLTIVLSLSIFSLAACGNSSEKAVRENFKDMGFDDEEIEELLEDMDSEDIEDLAELISDEEDYEDSSDETEEKEVSDPVFDFTMSDTIKNASLSDGMIQVYDMIIPIDGSITIGDFVKILESSSLELEYDIPKEGMVTGSESYNVSLNGNNIFTVGAVQISDGSYDNTYDSMFTGIDLKADLQKEFVWFPNGISTETDIDTLESILIASNLTNDDNPSKYHYYNTSGSSFDVTVPAKNNTLNDSRYDLKYKFNIDTSNKKISSFTINHVDTKMKDYAMALGYLNNATAISSTSEITDAIIAKLDEFDDVYIGKELEYIGSTITPTSASVHAITVQDDYEVHLLSECDTEKGIMYVKSPIAPIYVTESGDIFISYQYADPMISFGRNGSDYYGDVLVVD